MYICNYLRALFAGRSECILARDRDILVRSIFIIFQKADPNPLHNVPRLPVKFRGGNVHGKHALWKDPKTERIYILKHTDPYLVPTQVHYPFEAPEIQISKATFSLKYSELEKLSFQSQAFCYYSILNEVQRRYDELKFLDTPVTPKSNLIGVFDWKRLQDECT